ncbi:hypothetical protein F3Y22_tig00113716pilonHSYRG00079 [Hibiscus syriacus]|uniref:Uncharacterized protein n=1 Tax=Hibiscus syriacus TaxID=106335 RepID=A0A6A2XV44_HIBSY|nr:hypothetical protein F3Y22_tig00113716pilonHSYRG00079 [Hibiscus syriacus]
MPSTTSKSDCPVSIITQVGRFRDPIPREVTRLHRLEVLVLANNYFQGELPRNKKHPKLSYAELLHATDGFSSANLIGKRRYGSVYKGILSSGDQTTVAVKVLDNSGVSIGLSWLNVKPLRSLGIGILSRQPSNPLPSKAVRWEKRTEVNCAVGTGVDGVTCGRRHRRVTALHLSSLKLAGDLSPHIANLTFLRVIDLGNNSFRGPIPREVTRLHRLEVLSLVNNSFQGELPRNLSHCSNLKVINLNGNALGGEIHDELGSLSMLQSLLLAANNFIGTIPTSLGNISSLLYLSMARNHIE